MINVTVTCHKPTKGCGLSNPRTESKAITMKARDEESGKTVEVPKPMPMASYLLLANDNEHADHGHSHRVVVPEA